MLRKSRNTKPYVIVLKKIKPDELLYLFATCLITLNCILRKSLLGTYLSWMSIFTYISWMCFAIRIMCCKKSIRSIIVLAATVAIAYLCNIKTGDVTLVTLALRVFAAEGLNTKRILKVVYYSDMAGMMAVILCSLAGVVPDHYGGYYTLGFANINTIGGYIGILIVLWIVFKYDEIKKLDLFFCLTCILILAIWTGNRTTCLVLMGIIALLILLKTHEKSSGIIMRSVLGAVFCLCIVSVWAVISYENNNLLHTLNELLSGRLYQANYYYLNYSFSVWGQSIPELMSSGYHLVLDMGYMYMPVVKGWFFALVYVGMMYLCAYKMILRKEYAIFLLLLYTSVHLVTENFFCDMNLNVAIVCFPLLLRKKSGE